MSDKATKPAPRLAGATSFGADDDDPDYIALPPREVREKAKAGGAAIGFVSDKAAATAPRPAAKRRPRQPAQFPDHYNLKLREGDRERFDEYAYRHRLAKGEVFGIMLDLLEAREEATGA